MSLKTEILEKVKKDSTIHAKICAATGKSYPTVMRWINTNSDNLTLAACLNVICNELDITQDEALENLKSA